MKTKLLMTAIVLMATVTAVSAGGLNDEERKCFDAINQMRAKVGLVPFEFCSELAVASRAWSAKLREERRLYHGASRENCARGFECGTATFRQWMNSPGHRSLLMRNSIASAGIGAFGEKSATYWTFRVRDREFVPRVVETTKTTERIKKRTRFR